MIKQIAQFPSGETVQSDNAVVAAHPATERAVSGQAAISTARYA
jgi:hypothetical protein